jgi:hypothetical protein
VPPRVASLLQVPMIQDTTEVAPSCGDGEKHSLEKAS